MKSIRPSLALAIAALVPLSLVACGDDSGSSDSTTPPLITINVRATDDSLNKLLTEIYARALQEGGLRIGRKDPAPDSAAAYQSLEQGSTQLMVGVSTDLLQQLAAASGGTVDTTKKTPDEQTAALNSTLPNTLTVNAPTAAVATPTIACTVAAADEHSLTTISSLVKAGKAVRLGAPEGFDFALLDAGYNTTFSAAAAVDDAGAADAIDTGTVDCVIVPAVSPVIVNAGLLPLEDDKKALPASVIVAVTAVSIATEISQPILTQVNTALTTDVVRALMVKVESGTDYDLVAKQFLQSISKGASQ